MPNAQDQAFTIVARQRGLLPPERLEQAEALRREVGPDAPVAQLLLRGQLLPPEAVASVLRDLARRTFNCERCEGRVSYDALATLHELTCPRCGSPLQPGPGDVSSGAFAAVPPPGARPGTARYPAGPHPHPSGGFPAVQPPASARYPAPPSGGYQAVTPPSSGGYPAVAPPGYPPPSSGGYPAVAPPGAYGSATGSAVARPSAKYPSTGFHRAPGGGPRSAPPSTGPAPAPPSGNDQSGPLVRPTWTVEETVIDKNRRRVDKGSETGRIEGGRLETGRYESARYQPAPGSLDRPSAQGSPLDRPSAQGSPLDRPSAQGSPLDRPSAQGRAPLDRPSAQGRAPLDRPSAQGFPLDRPSAQGRAPLDRPSAQGSPLDRPSAQGRAPLDRPSEGTGRAAPEARWDVEATVLEKHRQSRSSEPVVDDTVREDIAALPIQLPTASAMGRIPGAPIQTEDTVRDDTVLRPPIQEGGKLGPYTILAELGRGASGVIYLAKRQGLERRFALKVLQHGQGLLDEQTVARFQREAQVASRIQDPGIIGVFDIGCEGDIYYYAMDYVPGPTLEERLQSGPLPAREAADVIQRLARSIHVAHEHGVIHRDLKPSNVIVDESNGRPRITDFGVARDQSLMRSITRTGELLGTPTHMAPEQLLGEPIDRRVDVYALGVMLYECLTGKPPFDGPSALAVAEMACSTDPAPPRAHFPDLPRELERICLKAMARDRVQRHASAAELADDLQRYLGGAAPQLGAHPGAPGRPRTGVPRWIVVVALVSAALAGGVLLRSALVRGPEGEDQSSSPGAGKTGTQAELAALRARLDGAADEAELSRISADLSSLKVRAAADNLLMQGVRGLEDELAVRNLLQQVRARAREKQPLRDLQPLLEDAESKARPTPRLLAMVKLERAECLRRRGSLEQAIHEAEDLLADTGPIGLRARMERARALTLAERYDEAAHTLQKLNTLDPGGALGKLAEALLRFQQENYVGANQLLEPALQQDPDLVPALILRGRIDTSRLMLDSAEQALRRAEELAPDDPEVHDAWMAWNETGNRPERALLSATAAVELCEPQPPRQFLIQRGVLNLRLGQLAASRQDLTRAVNARADVRSLFWRGVVSLRQGARDLAQEDLRRARALDEQSLHRLCAQLPAPLAEEIRGLYAAPSGTPREETPRLGADPSPALLTALNERARRVVERARAPLTTALRLAATGAPAREVALALDKAVAAAPDDPMLTLERAQILTRREDFDAAARAIEAARAVPGARTQELLLLECELAFRQGDQPALAQRTDALWKLDKGPLGHCARARLELLEGHPDQAFDLAEVALSLPGATPDLVHVIRLDALQALDRQREIPTVLNQALETEGLLDVRLAVDRVRAGVRAQLPGITPQAFAQAQAELERLLPLTPGPIVRLEMASLGLLVPERAIMDWGLGALDEVRPPHPQAELLRGWYQLIQRDPERCLASWRRARQLRPGTKPPAAAVELFREQFPDQAAALEQLLAD